MSAFVHRPILSQCSDVKRGIHPHAGGVAALASASRPKLYGGCLSKWHTYELRSGYRCSSLDISSRAATRSAVTAHSMNLEQTSASALLHQMPGLNISLPCRASRLCSTSTRSALTNDRCSHDEPETNLRPLHGRNTPARRGRGALCRAGRCGLQSNAGRISDPAPQRFEVAQAQTGGGSTLPGGASSLNETRASPKNNIVSTTCGVELSLQRLCSAGGTRYEQRSR